MNYQNKTVCVCDQGLFPDFAYSLSKTFGKSLYWTPWQAAMPKSNMLLLGKGMPGVDRIDDFWGVIDDIDLFVFTDVGFGPLQCHLERLGKRVWGSRMGEFLEQRRDDSKKYMKRLGIDIGPYKVVCGTNALRDYLKKNENQYVKVNRTRGDMETFKAENYNLVEPKIDEIEKRLGAKNRIMEFIVEEEIKDAVELGYDGYVIDGKYPDQSLWGVEIKDKGYLGRVDRYESLPIQLRDTNQKLASTFKETGYRGFYSSEIRATTDGKAYMIDPCARAGSPPSELYHIMYENLADILWHGAEGEVVSPKCAAKWGAELLLVSTWADTNWQPVEYPKSIRDNVRLHNMTMIDGKAYCVPQDVGFDIIGAVAAMGDSMDDAIANCRKIAEKVKGFYVDIYPEVLDEAKDGMMKLDKFRGKGSGRPNVSGPAEEVKEDNPNSLASLLAGKKPRLSDDLSEALKRRQ